MISPPPSVLSYAAVQIDADIDTDELAMRAMDTGTARATSLMAACETSNPWKIARQRGATIELDKWDGVNSLTLLGTYADGSITIYPVQIEEIAADAPLSSAVIRDLAVAHELAHHEFTRKPIDIGHEDSTTASFRERLWSWLDRGGGGSKATKTSLEEIAAHTLAGELVECGPLAHPLDLFTPSHDPVVTRQTDRKLLRSSRRTLSGFGTQENKESNTEGRSSDIHETHDSNDHNPKP